MRKDIGIIVLLIGIAFFFFVYKTVDIDSLEAQLAQAKNKLASLKTAAEQVNLLEQKIATLESKLPELQEALPSEADLEQLIKKFSLFARQSHLRLTSINSFKARKEEQKTPFKSWEVNFTGGTTNYENVLAFLRKIRDMKRAFEPVALSVSYNKEWRRKGDRLILYGRLKTYIRR